MATLSINATAQRGGSTLRARLSAVPWLTVMPLAVVLAYADGFWMIAIRGSVGSIERTQDPFMTWLRESTLVLPFFVLAVIGALTVAASWFGPAVRKPKTIMAAALLVVAAATLVGFAAIITSAAYDYRLQSAQIAQMNSLSTMAMGATAAQQHASFVLQVRAVVYGSGLVLLTNFVLVGWILAIRGGRLNVRAARH